MLEARSTEAGFGATMRQNTFRNGMPPTLENAAAEQAAQTLVRLCSGVLPVWARQLAASRAQSENAVSEMMQAFASIGPHLNSAQRQSQEITQALSQGDGRLIGLAQMCAQTLAPLRQSPQLPDGGAAAIDTVIALVSGAISAIEGINQPFSQETQVVAEQVERMYIGFQYQDRISQMIALLEGDIARLQQVLAGDGQHAPDLQAWLDGLEAQYAMAEQRQNHAGTNPAGATADGSEETTFF
jgi:methyl-accepting chemotaxis protein